MQWYNYHHPKPAHADCGAAVEPTVKFYSNDIMIWIYIKSRHSHFLNLGKTSAWKNV